jgi:hypothetical protein
MAGKINVTIALNGMRNMVREVPVCPDLQPALATCLGYISSTGISFVDTAGVYTIHIAAGFSAAHFDGNDGEQILVSGSAKNDGIYTIVSDTDTDITVTEKVIAESAGATVVIYGVQVYKITPTKGMEHGLIVYSEGLEASGHVGMIPCILNGDFWAANLGLYTAFAATAVTGTGGTHYLWVETAKFLQADGTILVMLKPIATKELYTWHRPALGFLQLP